MRKHDFHHAREEVDQDTDSLQMLDIKWIWDRPSIEFNKISKKEKNIAWIYNVCWTAQILQNKNANKMNFE